MKTKVVVIGGGNGSAVVLNGLKKYADQLEISAVISMSDSGGSSGVLRREFNTLPAGDILRAVLALSKYDYKLLKQIFYRTRFQEAGKLKAHNLGNLFLILSEQYAGDFMAAVRALEQAVEAVGRAHPVTLDQTDLCAELTNGEMVRGEANIDRPTYDRSLKIVRAWLEPEGNLYEDAYRAVMEAEHIFFSPGSLYASVIATVLPRGMRAALAESPAKLYYIAGNAYQQNGETGPETLSGAVKELRQYVPRPFELVVYNCHKLDEQQKRYYAEKQWGVLVKDPEHLPRRNLYCADFEKPEGGLGAEKLGGVLYRIITEGIPAEEVEGPAPAPVEAR